MELKRLIEIAGIQSTESSNRIEGIVTTNPRLKQLMDDKTTPRNRDEEEILGYRNVLALVHEDYNAIPVRPNYILQMHRDFLRFTNLSYGGSFKTAANEIDMVLGIGQYISIEKAIADTKESYYKALADAVKLWHEEKNDPKPFIKYMLGVILASYREFEARVTIAEKSGGGRSTSYDIVKEFVLNKIDTFTKQEAMMACPSLGSSSVESALKKLVEDGTLTRLGAGRKTHYVRSDAAI